MPAELLEGSAAIADAMIAAGCRFFAGYPMTPFTEVLERMAKRLPAVGGSCVNAESELEAIGMAWGAASTGTRAATGSTGQGFSLMQESMSEAAMAHLPIVVLNMARAQGDYFQATRGGGHGDYRTPVLAPMDVAEAVVLVQRAFHIADTWRNPVLFFGDYYLAHTYQSVTVEKVDFGPVPAKDWALDGSSSGTGMAKVVSPLGDTKQRDDVGYDLSDYYLRAAAKTAAMVDGLERLVDVGYCEDAEIVVVAFGTAGKYIRYTVAALRERGMKVGYVRPISLFPFPDAALREACRNAKVIAVYENNQGQMIDDVRLSFAHPDVARMPHVRFIGGLSLDSSGFGIAPDFDVDVLSRRIEAVEAEVRA
jgi:2-oxoglutarate ferredoxin oxidoreductase subunit alpha